MCAGMRTVFAACDSKCEDPQTPAVGPSGLSAAPIAALYSQKREFVAAGPAADRRAVQPKRRPLKGIQRGGRDFRQTAVWLTRLLCGARVSEERAYDLSLRPNYDPTPHTQQDDPAAEICADPRPETVVSCVDISVTDTKCNVYPGEDH